MAKIKLPKGYRLLKPGERVPYSVTSRCAQRAATVQSDAFTLQPSPGPGQPVELAAPLTRCSLFYLILYLSSFGGSLDDG